MSEDTTCVQELNQLLKGTHMGASLFEDLLVKAQDDKLKRLMKDCLKRLRKHEELLRHHVETMNEQPSESAGMFGTIAEMVQMIHQLQIENDAQVAKECLNYMESAIQALNAFEQRQFILEPMVQRSLYYMRDDYMIIYHSFHQYGLLHAE